MFERQLREELRKLRLPPELRKHAFVARNPEVSIKEEYEDTEYAHLPPFQEHEELENASKTPINSSKRKLRSCRVSSVDESRQLRSYDEGKQDSGNLSR